jgi:hypothetical protein
MTDMTDHEFGLRQRKRKIDRIMGGILVPNNEIEFESQRGLRFGTPR